MKETITKIEQYKIACYHCGDDCGNHKISIDEKLFCCKGCKTVYEILNDHALCDYYSFSSHPGLKSQNKSESEYAFLEEPVIIDQLLNFNEGGICNITWRIPSIHCSSCIWLLENLYKIHPGIVKSSIAFQKKELEVQFKKDEISLAQLAMLLDRLGYRPEITLEGKVVNNKSVEKALYYKIGIAGFCFGNIMLLSIPEYVSQFGDFNGGFKVFFSYLSLLLSLPVFIYSASDYFISAWSALRNKLITIDLPIAIGLTAAFTQSLLEILSSTGMGYLDSLTGLVFFLLIGKWYQQKTYKAISFHRDYKSFFPLAAAVLMDGKETFVTLQQVEPGDRILIRNQDVIPADGILKKGEARIDYSFVTGESALAKKETGDKLYAGGRQSGGSIEVLVTKKVSESYLTQLWNTDRSSPKEESGFVRFTNKLALYFTIAVLVLSAGTYAYWFHTDSAIALHAAISVLIIFCPCTLALAIPFCFGNAMNILSQNGFFLKNTSTIEKLTDASVIVFDKTGTVTHSGLSDVALQGFLTKQEEHWVKSLTVHSSHPLSRLITGYLKDVVLVDTIEFDESLAKGISGEVEGHDIRLGSAAFVGKVPADGLQNETEVYIRIDDQIKGRFIFKNSYRKGIPEVLLKWCKKYKLHLLSGDTDKDKEMMQHYFPVSNIHFNQSPGAKLNYIKALQKTKRVIMIGDGLNDAGALMVSHCGIAVSESSAYFSPACDAILEAEKIKQLPDFLAYAKSCVNTVRLSLFISLSYNVIGLYFACQGLLQPLVAAVLMPISSVSIVLFVTFMSNRLAKKYHLK